jgi:hypothetical protein
MPSLKPNSSAIKASRSAAAIYYKPYMMSLLPSYPEAFILCDINSVPECSDYILYKTVVIK